MDIAPISIQSDALRVHQEEKNAILERMQGGSDADSIKAGPTFGTMSQFEQHYPKFAKALMRQLAEGVMNDMRRHEQRMHEIMREANNA